ncbi:benzodiazapine receptor [Catalinimonas alkaloidigena]|uniref:TspO/MBR family protein n=1 Tax=Catalinimonas alkaloidigena TaxID=1075417 RepID=UPI002405AF70|nr:TspO/MBR family protein [Catalinimonas alkaloidigena]MDF9796644.1 benzodiazapine receptor [Catalinimonas alkaloidigena]
MKKSKLILNFIKQKTSQRPSRIKWWKAGLFLIAVTALGGISSKPSNEETEEFYDDEVKPKWAPPAWVFGPAWFILSIFMVWGGRRLLSTRRHFPYRQQLLNLQVMHWFDYLTFRIVYFRLKSPILAMLWTKGDAIIAARSLQLAAKSTDKKLAISYIPLTLWTSYASTLGFFQALYNPDPLFGTKAPLKVSQPIEKRLLKKR